MENVSYLIKKTLEGDQKSEKELYNKCNVIVTDYIKSKYGNYSDIEDDVIEIVSKIFIKLNSFKNTKSKFKTWIITITRNHLIDKWRKKDNNISYCDYSVIQNLPESCSEQLSVEYTNTLDIIAQTIKNEDFNLLNLKYVEGYKLWELGEQFSVETNFINNKINRIKNQIKKQLIVEKKGEKSPSFTQF
ncbi:MAG: RNA polymerase sigma factor [bacterium]